jgi:nucleoside-diphosphate-sugar epimerase
MTSNRTILITGVTGNQGGAVTQALQGAGFYLRGLTRKPDSERAAALARHGVDMCRPSYSGFPEFGPWFAAIRRSRRLQFDR